MCGQMYLGRIDFIMTNEIKHFAENHSSWIMCPARKWRNARSHDFLNLKGDNNWTSAVNLHLRFKGLANLLIHTLSYWTFLTTSRWKLLFQVQYHVLNRTRECEITGIYSNAMTPRNFSVLLLEAILQDIQYFQQYQSVHIAKGDSIGS